MVDFINIILAGVGLPEVLPLVELSTLVQSFTDWWQFLGNPHALFSAVFYFLTSYGIFSLTLVLMYRIVKKLVHYPHKKGCEYK